MKRLFIWPCLLLASMAINACNAPDSSGTIKTRGFEDPNKPTVKIDRRIMLALVPYLDIQNILQLGVDKKINLKCVTRNANKILWNCRFNSPGGPNITVVGAWNIQRTGNDLKVWADDGDLKVDYFENNRRLTTSSQFFTLDLKLKSTADNGDRTYAVEYKQSAFYTLASIKGATEYTIMWETKAQLVAPQKEFLHTILSQISSRTEMFVRTHDRGKARDAAFYYDIIEIGEVLTNPCGIPIGGFQFSGTDQPEQRVESQVRGLGPAKEIRYRWPRCQNLPFYPQQVLAAFVRAP